MGNIKVRDKNGKWVVVATSNAEGIGTSNPKLQKKVDAPTSADNVLEDHEDRLDKLERNVSWLAKHGGGGSGGGGGTGPSITEATCDIFVNNKPNGNNIIIDDNGLSIELKNISVQATKTWKIVVRIGSQQVAASTASFTYPTITVPLSNISPALINHTGNMYITASYEDEIQGIYGVSSWSGTVIESVVNLSTPNISVGLTDEGGLESDKSIVYNYSVGITGNYNLVIKVIKNNVEIVTKNYELIIIDNNINTFSVRIAELLSKFDVGVYNIESSLIYNDNVQIKKDIKSTLTLVSNKILISTTVMSEDQNNPNIVSLNGSINFVWTAYLQGNATFQYNYKYGDIIIKNDTIGYFGEEINDFVSVIGKDWAVQDKTIPIVLTVKVGSEVATKTWYVKFVKSVDSFLPKSDVVKGHCLSEFLAREYNNGEQDFTMTNSEYLVGGRKKNAISKIKMFNKSNLTGIKSSNIIAPYLRVSNGAYATLGDFNIDGSLKNIGDIVSATNNNFTVSISFKADYHPDDKRTVLCCGNIDSQTGELISGFEIDVHDLYINNASLIRLTDNVINNIDIVCTHSDDKYINSDGEEKEERHYIVKIYLEGALSAVGNYSTVPSLGTKFYIGGKTYDTAQDGDWLCDCNIYNLQIYDYALNDFDIIINYINNRVASTYKNQEFDFSIIDAELRKNFCERDIDGSVKSYIYKNNSYTIDFLLDGNKLSEEKLNQYAKAVGIPVMLIDVSTDDSWTFENFVNQQTADNVQLNPTSGKTISYWDPTQQNTAVVNINNATIELQGTSTLADAVKNINITVPNDTVFIPKDTWLPEQTYTLKADVVDSSHSNNASIGKFINTVLKDYFPSDPVALENVENSDYVKNQQPTATLKHTVEGFPILLIINFHTTETSKVSTTPLGIYSFNLGRDAFRNLGFRKVNKITDSAGQNINATIFPYVAENCTINETDSNANWIEIKDTTSIPDMAKFTGNSLPDNFDSSVGDFWQNDVSILNQRYEVRFPQGKQVADYTTFINFVGTIMSLPVEGCYKTTDRIGTINRPEVTTEYDLYKYDNGYIKKGTKQQIITDVNQLAELGFNAISTYKYFVIANLFGLADNFGKNSTYRSWNGGDYIIGFYDLDTALGGGNQGALSIEPNMWLKYLKNQLLEGKNYGFVAETFDSEDGLRLSNTVYSANHNKLWLSIDTNLVRNKLGINEVAGNSAYSYYWDDLRELIYNKAVAAGYTDVAEYFVNEFYLKQTGECGPLLFNLDYKLKYLVQFTNDKYTNTKHLSKLHGRKAAYTLDWLKKRILFLDSVFYWRNVSQKFKYPNDVNCKMSATVFNTPEYIPIKSNTDLIVYHNVGNATQTYYYLPKNTVVYVDAGNNNSNSEITWGITNSPQIIEIGDADNPLSNMNINIISHTNTDLHINNPGLPSITELILQNNNSFARTFNLNSFQPEIGVSEIRVLNFANVQSRIDQGARPSFPLELVKQLPGGQTDTKFTKLRELDVSNSGCISNISLPSVPLKVLSVYNSSLTELILDNQNYISNINLTGCTKLVTITIKECGKFEYLDVSNLVNLQEINIVNNAVINRLVVNNCQNLSRVTIQNNKSLTNISITNCPKLNGGKLDNYLTITDNSKLTTLNLSNNINLNTFAISNSNQSNISTLNLTNCPVTYISGDDVDTSILDLSKFTYGSGIIVTGNHAVIEIQYANNQNKPITINTTFQNCIKLKRIYGNLILSGVSGPIGEGMFRGCTNFTIHGWDDKALGPTTYKGQSTRGNYERVKTMWEILSGSATNKPTSGTVRPYSNITWSHSYVQGNKVTNFKMGTSNVNYMFYATSITQFDIYYALFVFATTINSNFSIYRTFCNLNRPTGSYIIFKRDTNIDNDPNRFTFYKCKIRSFYESFSPCGSNVIYSPEESYNIEGDTEENGVFSPLYNTLHSINKLTNGTLYFTNHLFKRYHGNYNLTTFIYQNMGECYEDGVSLGIKDATPALNKRGIFTNFFDNLPKFNNISNAFNFNHINLSTLKFNTNIVTVSSAFHGITTGTFNFKTIFENCTKLSYIYNSFVNTNTDSNYGTTAQFPITSDMFTEFPNLIGIGYNPKSVYEGSLNSFSFMGYRHYINQDTYPENIFNNNPNLAIAVGIFYQCEDKSFATVPKFPGNMFTKCTKLQNVSSFLREANFAFTLSSGGFANCPNLNNVSRIFYHSISKTSRSKLSGEIPAKLFYHGHSITTKTVYGSNNETKPTSDFDMNNIQSTSFNVISPRLGIKNISYAFSGCINLNYYSNEDNIDMVENNPDYSPYKWNYDSITKIWTENIEHKEKIGYWGYNGDPSTMIETNKYLEDNNIVGITEYGVDNKPETLHYMCAPDLLRYCTINADVSGLFYYSGTDIVYSGNINSDENYQSFGITGRIVPYLLKPVYNITNIQNMFTYCRRLSSYKQDGVIYQIPKDFLSYAPKITNLYQTFKGLDFVNGTNLAVFDVLKQNLDIRKIFSMCRYFKSSTGTKQSISNLFKNNTIIKLTGAFSENDIQLNGDYNGFTKNHWTLDNGDNISVNGNFTAGKVPSSQNINFVYYGFGDNATDDVIPKNRGNNY